MQVSSPKISRVSRIFIISLVSLFALTVSLLPAAAGRMTGKIPPAKSDNRPENNRAPAVPDGPGSPTAVNLVVNDPGNATDINLFDGICDTNAAPGNQCTLNAAISEANFAAGSDTITFSLPPSSTISLTFPLPELSGNLTMIGPGSGQLTVTRNAAAPNFRIFTTSFGATINISGMTISNGRTQDGSGGEAIAPGAGILQDFGTLTLTDVTVTGNRTGNGGTNTSGFQTFAGHGAGISSTGTLTMTNCTVSNNVTGNGGPNTSSGSSQGGFGGGINISGTLTMTNSVVSNNTTGNGGTGGSGGSGGRGAGIFIGSGSLTLNNVTITGNHTGDSGEPSGVPSGGNSGYGGGIFSDSSTATLTMTNVTISNNSTGNNISNGNVGGGAGIYLLGGNVTMTGSSVSNNHNGNANPGSFSGGGGSGAGIFNNGTFVITNSLINGNTTGNGGTSGVGTVGGGIHNNFNMRLINTTVSGNSTGVGFSRGGGIFNGGTMSLVNCTVTGNTANDNLGNGLVGDGPTSLRNTIIARNGAHADSPDLDPGNFRGFTSQGHNFIGNPDDVRDFTNGVNGDQVGTGAAPINPQLGPLANNGGPTLTHAPLDASTVLDAGDDCVTTPGHCGDANLPQLTSDQRGGGFTRIADGPDANTDPAVDIGAYERQALFPNLPDRIINEDAGLVTAFEVSDSASITSVTATSNNTTLVPNNPANLSVTGSGSLRILTINSVANLFGSADITVTVNRPGGPEAKTFNLTVNSVNDAPSFTKGADQTINENDPAQTINNWATNVSAGPADESAQTLTFQIVGNTNPGLFAAAPAISSSGTLTYTPATGVSGLATVTVSLKDNGGTTNGGADTAATQTFNLTVREGGSLEFSSFFGYTAFEGTPGIAITVVRNNGSAGEALVDYATKVATINPATPGVDYTATSGTLTFANGVTSQTFIVPIINDTLDEPQENIDIKLTNARGSGSLGSGSLTSIIILDDDPTPNLRINDVSVTEGESGTVNAVFTVTLSAASAFTVSANYATADNSASSASDYQATSGQITFNPGELTKTISVTVNGDTTPEVNESFVVNLSNATAATFADSQGVGTILSDDAPGGTIAFTFLNSSVDESAGFATVSVSRTGNTSAAVTVDYATSDGNASLVPCSTPSGQASARCDFTTALGTLRFAAGDAAKSFLVLINQDNFVEGPETLALTLSNATGGAVLGSPSTTSTNLIISDDVIEPAANPIDDAENFVRQHYHDFLNREADPAGLAFWTNQITSCGTDAQCIELKRINVSAAFYLSIEFQETGYLVERMYKVAYGNALGTSTLGGFHQFPVPIVRLNEFLPDTQELGQGLVVGAPGWEQVLENNKQAFSERFVQRARFNAANAFPPTLTASQFVDKLNLNAGGVLLPAERIQLINELSTGAKTRAQVVRTIAEDSDLVISEKNRAFVLMQFFGYLRRNPNDNPDPNHTGYEFWLNKLTQFGGNFVNAEMVKAFIVSGEYRQRFGQ